MVGSTVSILPPFDAAYPGEYIVVRTELTDDGATAFFVEGIEGIEGIEGGFDAKFLEVIHGA